MKRNAAYLLAIKWTILALIVHERHARHSHIVQLSF
jgi:hypothetical protein